MRQTKLKNFVKKGLFFKSVVEDGSDIIFIVDYKGDILYHNESVKQTLGYGTNHLVNKNFFDYLEEGSVPEVKNKFKIAIRKPFVKSIEFQFRCKDGTRKYLEFNSINLKHKEGTEGLILDCRDITQRKKDAEELLRAQKAKEQFMANISHEIRTPINGIAGMASLLIENPHADEAKTYLNAIISAAENLKVIINDILDVSIIESGKLQFEKIGFNLEDLVSSLEGTFAMQAKSKNIDLIFTLEEGTKKIFFGDPVRLNQILINLIGNALKFTQKGSILVNISIFKMDTKKCQLKFEVKDSGIGIAPDKLSKIFESFSQADTSVTRKYGGTGLGLTIVKQLTELQQGTIQVNSLEGVGSIFTVIIPYEISSTTNLSQKQSNVRKKKDGTVLKDLSILLVEDNDINRLYASSILKSWNCHYEMAENGYVALEKLKTFKPSVILMDIQMPVMDGFESAKSIRLGDQSIRNIPIIALTANATQQVIDKCLACGMNDYIPKPFSPGELLNVLSRYTKVSGKGTIKGIKLTSDENSSFDLTYLKQVSNNDKDFIAQIINSFLTNAPTYVNAIRSDLKVKNYNKIGSSVHKMKPSLTMIGAEKARKLALNIEELNNTNKSLTIAKNEIISFCDEVDKSINELKKFEISGLNIPENRSIS